MKLIPNSVGRVAIAAGAVLVLGGSAVGIAAAQQATPTPTAGQQAYQKFIDSLASKLGVSSQTLQSDISQARQDAGLPPNGGFGFGRGPGGPPGGPGGPRPGFGGGLDLNAAAQAIGISPQQLRQELAGKSLAQVAQAHGKTGNDVDTALKNAANARIDAAVSSGRLTSDQGNTQKTNVDNRIDQLVNQVMLQAGQGGPGGAARPGGPGRPGFPFGFGIVQQGLDTAAQAIGISTQQLQQELPGKTLTQVAQAHGKNPDDVATALKNAANTRIDQAVTNGRVTSDEANTQKTNIDARIDQLMNMTVPQGFQRRGGPGGQQQDQTGA
jgi:transposase-like protein